MITLIVLVALVVVLAALALVLDRLWVDGARTELTNAAEAAALAAGQELASDGLLIADNDATDRMHAARIAAAAVASQNVAAGQIVQLNTDPNGDVRFGRITRDEAAGIDRFLETDRQPLSVAVIAQRTRARNNLVSLFLGDVTGLRSAETVAAAEATLDNRVVGVRPLPGSNVPALPLAILYNDPLGTRVDSWYAQLTNARIDRYSIDAASGQVIETPDGLPEIVLYTSAQSDSSEEDPADANSTDSGSTDAEDASHLNATGNVRLVDLGTGLSVNGLTRQIASGLDPEDLAVQGGQLLFDQGPLAIEATNAFPRDVCTALAATVGQCRICLLYSESAAAEDSESQTTTANGAISCLGVAAGRILSVRTLPNNQCEIIYQPGVVTTRTAILADERPTTGDEPLELNPYIYKLRLTK